MLDKQMSATRVQSPVRGDTPVTSVLRHQLTQSNYYLASCMAYVLLVRSDVMRQCRRPHTGNGAERNPRSMKRPLVVMSEWVKVHQPMQVISWVAVTFRKRVTSI